MSQFNVSTHARHCTTRVLVFLLPLLGVLLPHPIEAAFAIAMSDSGQYQLAANLAIYSSSDFGQTWVAPQAYACIPMVAVSGDGRYQLIADAKNYSTPIFPWEPACTGRIFLSNDFGKTFNAVGPVQPWNGLVISEDGTYITAFAPQTVYTSADHGKSWQAAARLKVYDLFVFSYPAAMSASGQTQACLFLNLPSDSYLMLYSTDYGRTWATSGRVLFPFGTLLRAMTMNNNTLWAAPTYDCYQSQANDGTSQLMMSSDGGVKWKNVSSIPTCPVGGLKISRQTGQYCVACSYEKVFFLSDDHCKTWTLVRNISAEMWVDVAISADGKYITAVSDSGGFAYTSSDHGTTWHSVR